MYSRLVGYEDISDAERLALDPAMRHVTDGRIPREKLIKSGAEVIRHWQYVVFRMVEVAAPRILFREILG